MKGFVRFSWPMVELGATVLAEPFEIPVGRVAVVLDPFGNALVLLDLSKGTYDTDDTGDSSS